MKDELDLIVYGSAAVIIIAVGMGTGLFLTNKERGEIIEKQKQYCLSQCEKFAKDKGEFIECCHGCKEAAERTKIGE